MTDLKHIQHDSNMTITCNLWTLVKHKDTLGKDLFLQMDNCYRDNKNRYLLSFCPPALLLLAFRVEDLQSGDIYKCYNFAKEVIEVSDYIKVGNIAAVNLIDSSTRPYFGEVTKI